MEVESLYEEHHADLLRYMVRYCGDPDLAEDVVQETFVRLAERPPADERNLRAWLFTVATHLVRDVWRTRRRRRELLDETPGDAPIGDPGDTPETALSRKERRRIVRTALDELTEKERTVLLMREEGFAHREIAQAVGTTTGSIGTMIARAMWKLADHLPADAGGAP